GTESALLGEDSLMLDLSLEGSSLRRLGPTGFDSSESLFVPTCESHGSEAPIVCGAGRANVVRLAKRKWSPGMTASAILEFNTPPVVISAVVSTRVDEMHVRRETYSLKT